MWISDTSIKRPVFATMFILALVVMGMVSYPEIGVDLFPKVDFPIVSITTRLTGASPEIMDIDVTDKIEEAVNTISGIDQLISVSAEGVSVVTVQFVLEKDGDVAAQEVRDRVNAVLADLPRDADPPVIEKIDPDSTPVLSVVLSGPAPIRDLT
ncbi:efflux RND transporter permease subunit, partial [bacterium]|nr:efflux RND transporter permease subunit [bacterium]